MNDNLAKINTLSTGKIDLKTDKLDKLYLTAEELARLDKIPMTKQIQIMEHLSELFGLQTISEYCRINNISRSSIYKKDPDTIPSVDIGGVTFMFSNF